MARQYHVNEIKKGEVGNISKVWEEYYEYLDAIEQNLNIMAIIELSDMIGAIKLCYPINYDKVSLFLEKPEEELNLYDAICAYENNINDKTLKNLLYVIYIQYNKLSSMLSNKDLYRMTLKTMEVMQNDN